MAKQTQSSLQSLETLARLMDAQFKIPGTEIRFGLDAVIGLIPGIGDLSTFAVSAYMVIVMARKGASGYLVARMILNIVIDAVIGSIPIIGDMFDVSFKANMKNLRLMKAHYVEGKYNGSALKVVIPVLIIVLLLICGLIYLVYKLLAAFIHLL